MLSAASNYQQMHQVDQQLIEKIVNELKSQGIFDTFRKECIADVDTKPAYQNLRHRVEGNVENFLRKQHWKPDLNKNQVRELLRKNINESGFLETGVGRIVDQVVNPKINAVFLPKVEEVVYNVLGIEKPTGANTNPLAKASFNVKEEMVVLEMKAEVKEEEKSRKEPSEKPTTQDMIIDVENDMVKTTDNTETKQMEKEEEDDNDSDDSKIDEDESPPFEPLESNSVVMVGVDENSIDSHLSALFGYQDSNHSSENKLVINEALLNQNSSDSRLSSITNESNFTLKMDQMSDDSKSVDQKSKSSNSSSSKTRHHHHSRDSSNKNRSSSRHRASTNESSHRSHKSSNHYHHSHSSSSSRHHHHSSSSRLSSSQSKRDSSSRNSKSVIQDDHYREKQRHDRRSTDHDSNDDSAPSRGGSLNDHLQQNLAFSSQRHKSTSNEETDGKSSSYNENNNSTKCNNQNDCILDENSSETNVTVKRQKSIIRDGLIHQVVEEGPSKLITLKDIDEVCHHFESVNLADDEFYQFATGLIDLWRCQLCYVNVEDSMNFDPKFTVTKKSIAKKTSPIQKETKFKPYKSNGIKNQLLLNALLRNNNKSEFSNEIKGTSIGDLTVNTEMTYAINISDNLMNEDFALPLSPSTSDSSSTDNKKEDANMSLRSKHKVNAVQKITNQRYSSDDLYKPRMQFSSKRKGIVRNPLK